MNGQYSFSLDEKPPAIQPAGIALGIDTGSPIVSVALSVDQEIVAVRSMEQRQSSGRLLPMIDDVLKEQHLELSEVDLAVGLRGPGSFTGLRVGLATLLGVRSALGMRVGTLPTMQVLATLASGTAGRVFCCVDALRGDWLVQEYSPTSPPVPLGEPHLRPATEIAEAADAQLIGFGTTKIREILPAGSSATVIEPGPLAPLTLQALSDSAPDFDPASLVSPLYLQPPAVTLPKS